MEIRLNNNKLDAALETEKTVGDVLSALEKWLENSGHRLSGISINGEAVDVSMIEQAFSREIDTVEQLDIFTNIISNLAVTSLQSLLDDIKEYENMNFNEKANYYDNWKNTAQAQFIFSEINDLYSLCVNTFSSGEITAENLSAFAQERLREIENPEEEFDAFQPLIKDICEKLVRLPLDIQTGKDIVAARTIGTFSGITEKVFRLFRQLDSQGYIKREYEKAGKEEIIKQIADFSNVLKELLDAYEKKDSVLIGDIAEYEASEKLDKLYFTIQNNIKSQVET